MNHSLLSQYIIMPSTKTKLLLMIKNSMTLSITIFPVTFIRDISYLQCTKTLTFSFVILSSVKITIWPFILSITIIHSIFKTTFVLRTTFEIQFALSVEFSLMKVACVSRSVFESKCAVTMIEIVQKFPVIGNLISNKSALDYLSFVKSTFKSYSLAPLFTSTMQQSILKLTIGTLLLSNYCSQTIWKIIFIEPKIIKAICIIFSITISFGVIQFSLKERFVGHWCKLKICNAITVISSQLLYICSDLCCFQFSKQIVTVDSVVLQLFCAGFALPHFYSKLQKSLLIYQKASQNISFKNSLLLKLRCKKEVFRNHRIYICYVFLNMFLTNEQERIKKIILKNEAKSNRDVESQLKLKEGILKRRKRIERLQVGSVPNLIYIFPRINVESSSQQSSLELEYTTQQWAFYDLKSQNKKNKNYQTHSSVFGHIRSSSTGDHVAFRGESTRNQLTRSLKKSKQQSPSPAPGHYFSKKPKDIKESARTKEERSGYKKMDQINLSNYNSRKGDKTTLNSSKRLIVAQQYSLGNQQAKTKKVSQAVTLACRKKQPPRSRMATQHT